jgi:hypothetical protein
MRVALIAKPGQADTGVGRYTARLRAALEAQGHEVILVHPSPPPAAIARAARRLGRDPAAFFATYPLRVRYPPADLYHFAAQHLVVLLLLRPPPGPALVTVHDLIPARGRLAAACDRLARAGLRRADGLLADSEATRADLRRAGLVAVIVPLGVE